MRISDWSADVCSSDLNGNRDDHKCCRNGRADCSAWVVSIRLGSPSSPFGTLPPLGQLRSFPLVRLNRRDCDIGDWLGGNARTVFPTSAKRDLGNARGWTDHPDLLDRKSVVLGKGGS